MSARRQVIAALIGQLSLTRPLVFAAVLDAVVEAPGEEPDAQWWARWRALSAAPAERHSAEAATTAANHVQ